MIAGTDFSLKISHAKELSSSRKMLVSISSRDKLVLLLDNLPSLLYGGGQSYIFLCPYLPQHPKEQPEVVSEEV